MRKIVFALPIFALLGGCGAVNNALVEKTKTVEYYRIFDLKTDAARDVVAEAASNGLGKNVTDAQEATPIPETATPPDEPGRFKLVNPLAGSSLAALAGGGGGLGIKVATCEGAIWTASAKREITDSDLKLTACLFQYKQGYHLDVYAAFSKKEGGLMQISRSLASKMVGKPEEWVEKTFLDIVLSIQKETGAEVTYLEGQPKLQGTPWLDQI